MAITERSTIPPLEEEGIYSHPLEPGSVPNHIVVLRFHAFGDTVITLPLLAALRLRFPDTRIDVVTSEEYTDLFASLPMLDNVWPVTTRGSRFHRIRSLLALRANLHQPDLLLDLQRSRLSRVLSRLIRPAAFSAFDRFAPKHAIIRYQDAIRQAGIEDVEPIFDIQFQGQLPTEFSRYLSNIEGTEPLICLNPAGCWDTKNWPVERYAELGRQLIEEYNAHIVLLGTANIRESSQHLELALDNHVCNLTDRTTLSEALATIRRCSLIVSDDSGLMHLGWTNGVPTIGIFGASRGIWSRPWGPHTRFLGSEDLPCGSCMRSKCLRNDRICLTRVSVSEVFSLCRELLEDEKARSRQDCPSTRTSNDNI